MSGDNSGYEQNIEETEHVYIDTNINRLTLSCKYHLVIYQNMELGIIIITLRHVEYQQVYVFINIQLLYSQVGGLR